MKKGIVSVFSFSLYLLWAASGAAAAQTTDAPETDPHLVGWWKMDDASGKTAADASKHGRDGTLQGDLSFENDSVAGRVGKALQLDGKAGFIEITGYKGVTGTQPRTVALWMKSKATRGDLLAWGEDDFGKMFFFRHIRGRVGVTPSGGYLYINDQINDDRWHHVAAVVVEGDPPNLHDHVNLYLDGELAKIHDIGLLDLWPVDTGSQIDVTIGRGFDGALDEVRIYDRALSDEEVRALFRQK